MLEILITKQKPTDNSFKNKFQGIWKVSLEYNIPIQVESKGLGLQHLYLGVGKIEKEQGH